MERIVSTFVDGVRRESERNISSSVRKEKLMGRGEEEKLETDDRAAAIAARGDVPVLEQQPNDLQVTLETGPMHGTVHDILVKVAVDVTRRGRG